MDIFEWLIITCWYFFCFWLYLWDMSLLPKLIGYCFKMYCINYMGFCFFLLLFVSMFEYNLNAGWKCYKWSSQVLLRWLLYINFSTVNFGNKFGDFSSCLPNIGRLLNTSYSFVKLCIVSYDLAIDQGFFWKWFSAGKYLWTRVVKNSLQFISYVLESEVKYLWLLCIFNWSGESMYWLNICNLK